MRQTQYPSVNFVTPLVVLYFIRNVSEGSSDSLRPRQRYDGDFVVKNTFSISVDSGYRMIVGCGAIRPSTGKDLVKISLPN